MDNPTKSGSGETEKLLSTRVTMSFVARDLIHQRDLDRDFDGDLKKCLTKIIQEEGIYGISDDDGEVIKVEVVE